MEYFVFKLASVSKRQRDKRWIQETRTKGVMSIFRKHRRFQTEFEVRVHKNLNVEDIKRKGWRSIR